MEFEEFARGSTWVHQLDPRIKIIVAAVFSVLVALNNNPVASLFSLVLPIGLVLAAKLDPQAVFIRLAIVNGFIAFMWIFLPFTTPGDTVLTVGPLSIQRQGITLAFLITVKSNSIVLMAIALLATSQIFTLVHALSHLGMPNKLVHLFFFCFRYIHVIHGEYHRLVNAMKMRGFKPKTDIHTYRSYAYLVGMLLVRSFDRSKRILNAMKCRGFKGTFYILHSYEMKSVDYALAASSAAFSIALLALR